MDDQNNQTDLSDKEEGINSARMDPSMAANEQIKECMDRYNLLKEEYDAAVGQVKVLEHEIEKKDQTEQTKNSLLNNIGASFARKPTT